MVLRKLFYEYANASCRRKRTWYIIRDMDHKALHIIVDFNVRHKAARDMIAGIMRYATAHPKWELLMRGNHPSNDGFAIERNCPVHGIISGYDLSRNDEEDQREIKRLFTSKTTLRGAVFIASPPHRQKFVPTAWVDVDQRHIAQEAARLFLRNGLTNFAVIGPHAPVKWSTERIESFKKEIRHAGFAAQTYTGVPQDKASWEIEVEALRRWITALPKPCGVFATFDQRAKHVADICRAEGIAVPKQVQIVGVDNEESICELTVPSLSSIEPDFEATGYRAARELDRLLHDGKPSNHPILVKSLRVVERLSTSDTNRVGDRVSRALNFIRTHCQERIGVPQIARAVGGSIRLLEKDFKTVLGKSICTVIQDNRLQQVAKALHASSRPLSDIARQSGFSSETYLKNLFKKKFGMTMSQYRERN